VSPLLLSMSFLSRQHRKSNSRWLRCSKFGSGCGEPAAPMSHVSVPAARSRLWEQKDNDSKGKEQRAAAEREIRGFFHSCGFVWG